MKKNKLNQFLSISLILFLVSACSPATATTDPNQESTNNASIAKTAEAGVIGTLTQIAPSKPSDTPTLSFTETTLATSTLTPSATFNIPLISVSEETNCRKGPDKVYEKVGFLNPGVMVEVYGINPLKDYYFIENPSQPGSYCWVWGYYATTVSDFTGVPILTPGPTPFLVKTSTPGPIFTPTITGTITTKGGCTFVSQSPANNSKFKPGTLYVDFVWTVKNSSQSAWDDANVKFKFISGTNLHNVTSLNLSGDVLPGANATLLLDLNIPATNGTYTETWALVKDTTTLCSLALTIEVAP